MRRITAPFLCALVLATSGLMPARARQVSRPPLWGELSPGPYAVGFRAVYAFDRSRTWRVTRGYEKGFSPDPDGRPIRVSVWYPATVSPGSERMRYEDYITLPAPKEFADLESAMERRDRTIAGLSVPPERLRELLATPVNAHLDAPPAQGRFPLILHFGGLSDTATINLFVMAEFLASHGYVVATVPLLGPTNEQTPQSLSPADIEATVRDMEFAWSLLRGQSDVDNLKLGVMGHSLGGVEALIFAMRNANVSAAVGLDGTYGFAGSSARLLTNSFDYAPQKMRAALLDLRRPDGDQGSTLDLSAVHAFRYADRTFITVHKMHHSDFTSFATVAEEFHLGSPGWVERFGWTRETGYRGYQLVCEMVRDFFDEKLKGDRGGTRRLAADVARADGGAMDFEPAGPSPPSPREFADLIARRGFDSAVAVVERYRGSVPIETVVSESAFNSLGYSLIGEKRFAEAVGVLRLVTYVYPRSANAEDSLGDAYLAAGEKEMARAAFQKALELVADDPRFDAEGKKSFARDEQSKIEQLKP